MKAICFVLVLLVGLSSRAQAEQPHATCVEFKAGYDLLASQPFAADDGSLSVAIRALVDNHLIYSNDTMTDFATAEQLSRYLERLGPVDALIWLQLRFSDIENRMRGARCEFEPKRIVLMAPKPTELKCKAPVPDLSKPLK